MLSWMIAFICAALACIALVLWHVIFWMPGRSYDADSAGLVPADQALELELRGHVQAIAGEIGERNVQQAYPQLSATAAYIEKQLVGYGYTVNRQLFRASNREVVNVSCELAGIDRAGEILVIGAHYDTIPGCPGANDNTSAIAANLALARALKGSQNSRTVRFVFFVNEEAPFFMTEACGSLQYARRCQAKDEKIVGMMSLETMGYFSSFPETQAYPWPLKYFFPNKGNFIAFVGNVPSRRFVHQAIAAFRRHASIPSEGIAATTFIADVCRSDHFAFWLQKYPALMVTDTANFRYPEYHTPQDTPGKLNYEALARVVDGLDKTLRELLNPKETQPDSTPLI